MTGFLREPVLVTRAGENAAQTIARLREAGFAPIAAPLTEVRRVSFAPLHRRPSAYVLTSANAAYALEKAPPAPVFAVGEATADAARVAGAEDVTVGPGDAAGLSAVILGAIRPMQAPLAYLRGAEIAFDMAGALKARDRRITERIVYEIAAAEDLAEALRPLRKVEVAAVTVHAASAARVLAEAARSSSGVSLGCEAAVLAGISEKAVAPLRDVKFSSTIIAQVPRDEALIAALCAAMPPEDDV